MHLLNRLKHHEPQPSPRSTTATATATSPVKDEIAIAMAVDRYRHLLRTATPGTVEEVHAEALARLSPQQRHLVFETLSRTAAASDRPAFDDPRTLARSATRSERRQPGFLERTLGTGSGALGRGAQTVLGATLLGTVAGVVIESAIADMVMPGIGDLASNGFGDSSSMPTAAAPTRV